MLSPLAQYQSVAEYDAAMSIRATTSFQHSLLVVEPQYPMEYWRILKGDDQQLINLVMTD